MSWLLGPSFPAVYLKDKVDTHQLLAPSDSCYQSKMPSLHLCVVLQAVSYKNFIENNGRASRSLSPRVSQQASPQSLASTLLNRGYTCWTYAGTIHVNCSESLDPDPFCLMWGVYMMDYPDVFSLCHRTFPMVLSLGTTPDASPYPQPLS